MNMFLENAVNEHASSDEISLINNTNSSVLPIQKINAEDSLLPKESFENIGRNDICPCGSGKKFKQCHGKN
jgi:uncharacterized protein YecA (UPF0149 family)